MVLNALSVMIHTVMSDNISIMRVGNTITVQIFLAIMQYIGTLHFMFKIRILQRILKLSF